MQGNMRAGYRLRERNRGGNAANNGEYMQPIMGRNATYKGKKCNQQCTNTHNLQDFRYFLSE